MRWLSGILLVAAVGIVLVLGLTPTSFGLSNGLGAVECRAVLGQAANAFLAGADEIPSETLEEWLLDVGYDDDGVIAQDVFDAAVARGHELCAEARTGRLGWMLITGLAGLGLAGAAATLAPRPTRPTKES